MSNELGTWMGMLEQEMFTQYLAILFCCNSNDGNMGEICVFPEWRNVPIHKYVSNKLHLPIYIIPPCICT
jgi:hypothetical protein